MDQRLNIELFIDNDGKLVPVDTTPYSELGFDTNHVSIERVLNSDGEIIITRTTEIKEDVSELNISEGLELPSDGLFVYQKMIVPTKEHEGNDYYCYDNGELYKIVKSLISVEEPEIDPEEEPTEPIEEPIDPMEPNDPENPEDPEEIPENTELEIEEPSDIDPENEDPEESSGENTLQDLIEQWHSRINSENESENEPIEESENEPIEEQTEENSDDEQPVEKYTIEYTVTTFDEVWDNKEDTNNICWFDDEIFSIFNLAECFVLTEKNVLEEIFKNKCNLNCNSGSDYSNADILLISFFVLQHYIENKNYYEAQQLLNQMETCNGLCRHVRTHLKGCGCNGSSV